MKAKRSSAERAKAAMLGEQGRRVRTWKRRQWWPKRVLQRAQRVRKRVCENGELTLQSEKRVKRERIRRQTKITEHVEEKF